MWGDNKEGIGKSDIREENKFSKMESGEKRNKKEDVRKNVKDKK